MESHDLALAIEGAKGGGKIVREGFGNIKHIESKGDKGFVTEIDKASEAEIISILIKDSPYSFLGEESGRTGDSDTYWVIDPLDGTTNFCRGIPLFGVNIALIRDDEVVVAAIYDPMRSACYSAEKGCGAFCNGKPIHVSDAKEIVGSLLQMSSGYDVASRNVIGAVMHRLAETTSMRRFGTSAIDMCLVASGSADAFVNAGDELWDYAPGLLLMEEAGAKVADWRGQKQTIHENYILAANARLHEKLSKEIGDLQS